MCWENLGSVERFRTPYGTGFFFFKLKLRTALLKLNRKSRAPRRLLLVFACYFWILNVFYETLCLFMEKLIISV